LGNVNYSLNREKSKFNRTFAAEMVIKALKPRQSNLFLSPRHDIFINAPNEIDRKVSGSAYKLSRDRAYHHGTLLLSTDLTQIARLLQSPLKILKDSENFKFGGVSSVPSPVSNVFPQLSFEDFVSAMVHEFKPTEGIVQVSEESFDASSTLFDYKRELESWNWTFSKSPPFRVAMKEDLILTIQSGIVTAVESSMNQNNHLIGTPFSLD
jgi:lipoate---protein ligase